MISVFFFFATEKCKRSNLSYFCNHLDLKGKWAGNGRVAKGAILRGATKPINCHALNTEYSEVMHLQKVRHKKSPSFEGRGCQLIFGCNQFDFILYNGRIIWQRFVPDLTGLNFFFYGFFI